MKHDTHNPNLCTNTYQELEKYPDSADREYTVAQAELAHRYGTPWPISADHTNRKYGKPYER